MENASSRMMSMRDVRPYDQSLALKTIARSNDDAFRIAVLDPQVREYLISQRESHFTARSILTSAWARGFAKHTEEFVAAIHETGESPKNLAVLTGLPPEGMELVERARRAPGVNLTEATPELMASHLSAATLNDVDVEVLYDVASLYSDQDVYRALRGGSGRGVGKSPLETLLDEYDGDTTHLFVHLAYRRLGESKVPIADVLRLNAIGLVDPVTLTRAAEEDWPDEYAHALDAD